MKNRVDRGKMAGSEGERHTPYAGGGRPWPCKSPPPVVCGYYQRPKDNISGRHRDRERPRAGGRPSAVCLSSIFDFCRHPAANILQDGDIIESRFAITKRNRTIHARMREYLYTLKHHEQLETSILPLGDGVALSVKK